METLDEVIAADAVDHRLRDGVCTDHWGWNDSWQLLLAGGPPTR